MKYTSQTLHKVLVGLSAGVFAVAASAAPVIFTFSNEFSGTGLNCNASCATLSVEQVGADVQFTFTGSMDGLEFLSELYGNRDPYADSTPTSVSKTGFTTADFSNSGGGEVAAFKADGDGFFDWKWEFGTAAADRFDGTDVLSWTFASTSIDDIIGASSTGGPEGKTGFTFAIHAQGLGTGGEGSGWLYAVEKDDIPVPEPGSLALFGLGLIGIAGLARRRKSAA